ncbi:hypothetical protein SAMN00790413_04017 [Deinococcus hopiensis KR-140]|uniref:Uncharacterized protein n=1 Tax=Deinococcus hopiensis KR-140 TaxID=695939 RepID=A0A1W1UAW0_9DEIO|nr:hypothetical protein SAMN00790413_04017 [Deinococcus hopiensis KR-140]
MSQLPVVLGYALVTTAIYAKLDVEVRLEAADQAD